MKITIESDKKDGSFFYTLRKDGEFVIETSHWKQLTLPEILRGFADMFEYKASRLAAEFKGGDKDEKQRTPTH